MTEQWNEKRQRNKESTGQSRAARLLLLSVFALGAALLLGRIFPYYYDLNDDALMAQILAGSYTGEPELRNIQSYFPLTAVLGGLYRANRSVDWYGLFLLLCQFGCLALVLGRIMDCRKEVRTAALAVLAAAGLLLYHMVFLQYSVTVGMIGAAASLWLLTLQPGETRRAWRKELLPPVLLIALGYLLRSEMMLFVGPFAALAFLIRVAQLKMEKGEKLRLMAVVLAMVLLSLFAGEAGNRIGDRLPVVILHTDEDHAYRDEELAALKGGRQEERKAVVLRNYLEECGYETGYQNEHYIVKRIPAAG